MRRFKEVWSCVTDGSVHVVVLDTKVSRGGVWVDARASQMIPQFNALHEHAKRWALERAIAKIKFKIAEGIKS